MADISASAVASLRSRTGVSILECKKALEEAGGDEEKAIEILRKSGAASAVKKAGREQSEGAIFIESDGSKAAALMIHCETDFVARNDDFVAMGEKLVKDILASGVEGSKEAVEKELQDAVQKLGENITLGEMNVYESPVVGTYVHSNRKIGVVVGLNGGEAEAAKDIAMHAAAMNPAYVRPDDVAQEDIDREKTMWVEQLKEEGKPEEIMDKIIGGKEKKFREENALTTQEFVKDPSQKVGDLLSGAEITEYIRLSVA